MPLYRRVPKLKHFPLVNPKSFTVINVSALNDLKAGSTVNLDSLVKSGLVTSPKNPLKVLAVSDTTFIIQSGAVKAERVPSELIDSPDFNQIFMGLS